ncbi:PIN domain-containing protein [Rhodocaloribacter litoris]|uniref:type II toxin-antitoxin system VapC family toxin n=1 Tax=Rhodocaloribacter litoris TaxID=2558931 RepID=UPI001422B995|nr:PIN domain-containing protein [Rhodocaloribacter litoris]QXD14185.1 PIN domain-containing protein [Rhodocaloribacter litoris]
MRQAILDTGPLVAFFNPRDRYHTWALEQTRDLAAPLVTCEAVLTEAYHLLGRVPRARAALRRWIRLGRVTTPLHFDEQAHEVMRLLEQYADQSMDFADACVVRLAELLELPVFTLDVQDFSVYRLHRRKTISLIRPPA